MRLRTFTLVAAISILTMGSSCPMAPVFVNDPTATEVSFTDGTPNQLREGTSTANATFNSTCQGFFPDQPNHVLDIEQSTSLEVRVSGDPGVVVRLLFGQSNFCASPGDPLLRFFTTGQLEIFVGADEAGKTVAYTLEFVR